MMFKKMTFICTAICLFILSVPIHVSAEQTKSDEADILIIYDNQISDQGIENVTKFILMLTYQKYSVAYGTVSECLDFINLYDNIICFDLDKEENSLISKLAETNSRILILGNTFIEGFLPESGMNLQAVKEDGEIARITYNFSGMQEVTSLVEVPDSYVLQGDVTYERGSFALDEENHGICMGNDKLHYIPIANFENELDKSIVSMEIAQWMKNEEGEYLSNSQYIVFDKVYPFTNVNQILSVVDVMIETDTPFVISVMPIYQHADYPSMKRFCEVLRYAQVHEGAVILRCPVAPTENFTVDDMQNILTIAMEAYTNYGVYPVAIEVPASWLYQEQGQEVLKNYNTVFVYDENTKMQKEDLTRGMNSIFSENLHIISPAISCKAYPTAIYRDITEDVKTLKKDISTYKELNVQLKSLWELPHLVATNTSLISYENKVLTFNNEPVDLEYEPFTYEKDYDYKRNLITRITVNLESQNKILIVIVLAAILLFILFILQARVINKKKFFYTKEK